MDIDIDWISGHAVDEMIVMRNRSNAISSVPAWSSGGSRSGYDDWALYYDIIHEGLPGDVDFYVNLALRRGNKALELGVGTGRIAIPMTLAGIDVTGLDNSRAMLALCREKASLVAPFPGALRLVEADMAGFDLGERFPFIAMPYRAFMHLLTREEQRGCLYAVRRHLPRGGVFAFDVWAARPSLISCLARQSLDGKPRLVGRYKADDARVTVVHRHRASVDEKRQLLIERHVIEERDQRGRIVHTADLPMARAYFSLEQIRTLARECGFDVKEVYGDFAGGSFNARSDEMVLVLYKTRD